MGCQSDCHSPASRMPTPGFTVGAEYRMVGLPDEGHTLGGEGVCVWESRGSISSQGGIFWKPVTLSPVDLASGAQPSVFLQGPVPRTNQCLSVVL